MIGAKKLIEWRSAVLLHFSENTVDSVVRNLENMLPSVDMVSSFVATFDQGQLHLFVFWEYSTR